jgi:hypothetical protein
MVADSPESSTLSEVALFRGLPAEQLYKIEARVRRRTFPAGAHVITVEEPGETVYVVLEGSVKVYVTRPDGTEARKPPTHRAARRTHALQSIACRCAPRRSPLSWQRRSRQELVNVMVVAILDAGVDTAGPRGPEAIADPALAEGGHARRGRPVGGIAGIESIGEIRVLNLDRVAASGYRCEYVLVLTDGCEGGIILDPAQHVRYTSGVHKTLLMGRAPGCC